MKYLQQENLHLVVHFSMTASSVTPLKVYVTALPVCSMKRREGRFVTLGPADFGRLLQKAMESDIHR